jgi:hypothetical protein
LGVCTSKKAQTQKAQAQVENDRLSHSLSRLCARVLLRSRLLDQLWMGTDSGYLPGVDIPLPTEKEPAEHAGL